jgi:transcriptional regulator with GAF, ATPase, and Fis domain
MTMTASDSEAGCTARLVRRRDRRRGLGDLLAALSRAMADRADSSLLRGAFEEAVRRVVPVRSVRLRDNAGRWSGRAEGLEAIESITLDVPGGEAGGVLEAAFEPGSSPGEWDCQLLGIVAHIAAFVLEIERSRLQLARAGLPAARPKRPAAAPLIGSTPAMQALRGQIDRVAGTDFTILLEGASDPQQSTDMRLKRRVCG